MEVEKAHSSHVIHHGSNSTILTLIPSRPCRSWQPERALRSWAAYSTPTAIRDSQQHVGICTLRDTPANYSGRAAAACSWCAAFAAFGYDISGPTPGSWPWSRPRSQQHIRGHTFIWCASSEPSATSFLSRCWGVCISRWHNLCQKIPRQLHSMWIQWEITVLCQPPQIISSQFPHSCVFAS